MTIRISKQKENMDFPIILMLILCANKWLIEGILNATILELVALLGILALVLLQQNWRMTRSGLVWMLYCFSLIASLVLFSDSINTWGRAGIMVALCLIAAAYSYPNMNSERILRTVIWIAVFHGILVIIQFFFKSAFNSAVFPLFNANSQIVAKDYARKGYYFGILYAPHEVAGIFVFALAAILLKMAVRKKLSFRLILLTAVLALTLLLTNKKGVIAVFVLATLLCIMILYATKKDYHRLLLIFLVGIIAATAVIVFMLNNPDNPFLYRFASYLKGLIQGNASDSGRGDLYAYAIKEWQKSPLIGIGWYQFTRRTTEVYGYATAHHVNFDYLQWLTELGIVGFVLNMIPVCVTLYQTIWICRKKLKKIQDEQEKTKLIFAVFIQFFTLIYAFLEVPFYDLYFFAMYILSCNIINGFYYSCKVSRKK